MNMLHAGLDPLPTPNAPVAAAARGALEQVIPFQRAWPRVLLYSLHQL